MANYLRPLALQATPGMPVSKQDQNAVIPHTILEVNRFPDRKTQIVTNEGTWIFNDDEIVAFPRRPDGVKYDWTIDPTNIPTVQDLAIGDILPSQLDPDPRLIEVKDEEHFKMLMHNYEQTKQVVSAIWRHPRYHQIWHFTAFIEAGNWGARPSHRRYDVKPNEKLIFPRPPKDRKQAVKAKDRPTMSYQAFGPYVVKNTFREGEFAQVVMFATHPNGRGRWPQELGDGLHLEIDSKRDLYICRAPTPSAIRQGVARWKWDELHYLCDEKEAQGAGQWGRHSADPKWGKIGHNHNPQYGGGLRIAAMERYETYRKTGG